LSFGSAAEAYERYRMGYPDELVAAVLEYAGRPVHRALEVGAGTGKATRLIAAHGIEVTALEPDPDMAQVLNRTTQGLPVHPLIVTFESFRADRAFDLLYSAAAWHWTDPAQRWTRAVELLAPGCVLALFGHPHALTDADLTAAVEEIERRALPDSDAPAGEPWSLEDVERAAGFTDVEQRSLPSGLTTTAENYLGRLATSSAYLVLDATEREETLRQIRDVLPERFEVDTTVRLTLARRV
jgi:trans-aconitate methyltransferase